MSELEKLMRVARGEVGEEEIVEMKKTAGQTDRGKRVATYEPNYPTRIKVAFIGEAPGKEDVEAGMPFAGYAGDELRRWCEWAGVDFETSYLDYVYPYYSPGGSIENIDAEEMQGWMGGCHARLVDLLSRGIVPIWVPLGNLALEALTGRKGITKHRGNVFPRGTGMPYIVPMLNPAVVQRNQNWRRRCVFDMKRVKRLIKGEDLRPAEFTHHLLWCRDESWGEETERAVSKLINGTLPYMDQRISIDIETAAQEDRITCIGFSWHEGGKEWGSVTVQWPVDEDNSLRALSIRQLVRDICESSCEKVLHNGLYDAWWLKRYADIEIKNWQWDTLCMAHAWYPADNLSLEYLTSILTLIPYYKDEGKDHFGSAPETEEAWMQLMTYCGRDAVATLQCFYRLDEELVTCNRLNFYQDNYPPKFKSMLDLMLTGVRIDNARRKDAEYSLLDEARVARDELMLYNDLEPMFTFQTKRDEKVWKAQQNGENVHAIKKTTRTMYKPEEILLSQATLNSKTVSNAKLQTLLYDKLGLPVQYERRANGTETPTAGDLTLRRLRLEYGKERPEVDEVIRLAQQHNKAHKLATFCYDSNVDEDGRMRFSLKFTPETGRFASSKSPKGTGANSQQLPRDPRIRQLILPKKGDVLLKMDMSQVEARFCFVYTHDPELIRLANLRSTEYDQHRENAVILKLAPDTASVTSAQRQLAKQVVHGAQRNMQGATLADTLLRSSEFDLDMVLPSIKECDEMLETYHRRYPAIRGVFFEETRKKLQRDRQLTNSWGRTWSLEYEDLNDEVMRRAFSFLLQSEAADLINRYGFVPIWTLLHDNPSYGRVMLHAHDELVLSCRPGLVYEVMAVSRDMLERSRLVDNVEVVIPIEYGLGTSWAVQYEWKELPLNSIVEKAVKELLKSD